MKTRFLQISLLALVTSVTACGEDPEEKNKSPNATEAPRVASHTPEVTPPPAVASTVNQPASVTSATPPPTPPAPVITTTPASVNTAPAPVVAALPTPPIPAPEVLPAYFKDPYFQFVTIEAGSFFMGSQAAEVGRLAVWENGLHKVTISKNFDMQTTEVTQGFWLEVMGTNPATFNRQGDCAAGDFAKTSDYSVCKRNPVETISWNEAKTFIAVLNRDQKKYRFRLPTEAEWEYAARGKRAEPYGISGPAEAFAWVDSNSSDRTHPVATKLKNEFGLFDMHGNVWEYVQDWLAPYENADALDPICERRDAQPIPGAKVIRGGSFANHQDEARSAMRSGVSPNLNTDARKMMGLRLVRELKI